MAGVLHLGELRLHLCSHLLRRTQNSIQFVSSSTITSDIPREAQSNIFIEHILPLWKQAPETSPLRLAASATASNILGLWRMQGPEAGFSQAQYGKALVALRQAFQDPNAFNDDEVLGSMFMLDFFESVNRRYQQATDVDVHQRAAMALVKARGRESFKTETSRRLFTALRARYIVFNLQARRRVDLDDAMLQEDPDIDLPGEKLDLILADLANTMHEGRHLLEPAGVPLSAGSAFPMVGGAPAHNFESSDETMTFETLLSYLLELNLRLNGWHASLPLGWARHRIPNARETLHYSIRAIGLYHDLCDVYSSMAVAHAHNGWRTTQNPYPAPDKTLHQTSRPHFHPQERHATANHRQRTSNPHR